MITVLSGETGGYIDLTDTSLITLNTAKLFGAEYQMYTISGGIVADTVRIPKRAFASLPVGWYVLMLDGHISATQTKQYTYDLRVRRKL